jgi:hypothetical protein
MKKKGFGAAIYCYEVVSANSGRVNLINEKRGRNKKTLGVIHQTLSQHTFSRRKSLSLNVLLRKKKLHGILTVISL